MKLGDDLHKGSVTDKGHAKETGMGQIPHLSSCITWTLTTPALIIKVVGFTLYI